MATILINGVYHTSFREGGGGAAGMDILELSTATGTLTSAQLALVQSDHCIIKYSNNYYYKSYHSTNGCDYVRGTFTKTNASVTDYYFTCDFSNSEFTFGSNADERARVVANPTLGSGESATPLQNIRVAGTAYSIPAISTDVLADKTSNTKTASPKAVYDAVMALAGNESYVTAWDGESAPVAANIPAGVTVTYSGQTTTGSLAASENTDGKIYLVSDTNGNFYRYLTQLNGSTYSWVNLGSTEIDLSDYATKAELNQLDQIQNVFPGYFNTSGVVVSSENYVHQEEFTPVKAGDTLKILVGNIGSTSSPKMAWYTEDKAFSTYTSIYNNRSWTISSNGYVRCSYPNDPSLNLGLLVNGVKVFEPAFADGAIKKTVEKLAAPEAWDRVSYFVGKNETFVSTTLKVAPGRYRITLFDTAWGTNLYTTEASRHKLEISSVVGTTTTIIVKVTRDETPKREYIVDIPDGADLKVGGRANIDTKVWFQVTYDSSSDIYIKNRDKLDLLRGASLRNNRLQVLIVTDTHGDWNALRNAVSFANDCSNIAALVALGDYTNDGTTKDILETFKSIAETSTKPILSLVGNHDAGHDYRLRFTALADAHYEYITRPTVDFLESGEYTEGKPYFFHDFPTQKIRMIALYEFEDTPALIENEYWEAVEYDNTADAYAIGETYAVDDVVNFGLYSTNSFKCIQAHTSAGTNEIKLSRYHGYRYIGQTQMEWLVSTLNSTPADYGVVICTHIPSSGGRNFTTERQYKFCNKSLNFTDFYNFMTDDVLGTIANAFTQGTSGSLNVTNTASQPAYTLAYDFTNKAAGAKFLCFLSGHTHVDFILKDAFGQYNIVPIYSDSTTRQYANKDVPTSTDKYDVARDSLTAVAFDVENDAVILTRVGTTATTEGYRRDTEKIELNP